VTPDELDRADPAGAIADAAKHCSNWGRWGQDDVLGTLNFLDEGVEGHIGPTAIWRTFP
jgi:hypothetical protein